MGAVDAIAPSGALLCTILKVLQEVQSKALEGAVRPAEGAFAPSASVWLWACLDYQLQASAVLLQCMLLQASSS